MRISVGGTSWLQDDFHAVVRLVIEHLVSFSCLVRWHVMGDHLHIVQHTLCNPTLTIRRIALQPSIAILHASSTASCVKAICS